MLLELGTGANPTEGFIHADKWQHAPYIDMAFDLEKLPWPLEDGSVTYLLAIDVFEHLHLEVQQWLDECHRVLCVDGALDMRLPSFSNPLSFRDPTHQRIFHPESFYYWTPNVDNEGLSTVWTNFGRYYFGGNYSNWWRFIRCETEHSDLRFVLMKPTPEECREPSTMMTTRKPCAIAS